MKPARVLVATALLAAMAGAGWWLGSRQAAVPAAPPPRESPDGKAPAAQGLLQGRVLAPEGEAFPASCKLEARSSSARATEAVSADGSFRLQLAAGRWAVRAVAAGGQVSDWKQLALPAGTAMDIALQLRWMRVVQGHVHDASGAPLRDFGVVLVREAGAASGPQASDANAPQLGRSSDNGHFAFLDLDDARYYIYAGSLDRPAGPVVESKPLPFGDEGDVAVLADEVGHLHLRIVSSLGGGVPDVQVRLLSMGNGAAERRRSTDGGGRLEFEDLQCGQWTIVAESPHGAVPPEPVEVRAGVQELELTLARDLESRKRSLKEK